MRLRTDCRCLGIFQVLAAVFERGSFRVFAEHLLKIRHALVAKGGSNVRDWKRGLGEKLSCLLDAVDIDVFVDGITGAFFENPA